MSDLLGRLLDTKPFLLADGATGTSLFAMGLQTGDAPELWNVEHADRVAAHYRSFVDAGSDIILSNTFGANRHRLKLHRAADRVAELNQAAAQIAREEVARARRDIVVAGSMGPTGEVLAPLGALAFDDACAAFEEQARALAGSGVDVLWIETMSSREEVEAAVTGAAKTGLPTVCTLSFDTNGATMMGVTPADFIRLSQGLVPPLTALGTNCGVGAAEVITAIVNMSVAAAESGAILVAKANCGIPEYVDGAIRYDGTPELMAQYARLALNAGARIIGGCCGTTGDHIRAMRHALDNHVPGARPDLETIVQTLGEVSNGARVQLSGMADPNRLHAAEERERRSRRRGRARPKGS